MRLARENDGWRRVIDGSDQFRLFGCQPHTGSAAPLNPASLALRQYLPDGDMICLRAIDPGDRVALRDELFLKLGTQSLRNRFLGIKLDLSADELTRFCQVDFRTHVAVVAEITAAGRQRLIGVGRFVRASTDAPQAEIAITVQDDYQGRGIGGLILRKLVGAARELGIDRLEGSMFAQNHRMKKLMQGAHLPCDANFKHGILAMTLDLRPPSIAEPPGGEM